MPLCNLMASSVLPPGTMGESITKFFKQDSDYGVVVKTEEDGVSLELNLIIEYGLRIKTVTDLVAESVKYAVEKNNGGTGQAR